MRYSKQREAIRAFVIKSHDHPTAQDVYQGVQAEFPNISLGTVYRNLVQLAENGDICTVNVSDGSTHFDGHTTAHQHFTCVRCGKIFDVNSPHVEEIQSLLAKNLPGQLSSFELTLRGICTSCLAKEQQRSSRS
ncbi:transcriptional repressor [Atopobium sp. oral taxon 810]|uniref:Fur family transcriptional regulator n=1 Tax=Atopobium sp. oral taxon 810 TaxID=712158 RepID=UPI000396741C|nr:transcriptional repressor [Atopobium sp. oral taxon 810]ERI05837.1 transcriptional regulator, Fur family [Atopobium sp. oral taxon 810 str. F0209]